MNLQVQRLGIHSPVFFDKPQSILHHLVEATQP